MNYLPLFFFGIAALLLLSLAWPYLSKLIPASGAKTTADSIDKYAKYATAHAALYTLRIIDIENENLDIGAELTSIDAKMALAMKAVATVPATTPIK